MEADSLPVHDPDSSGDGSYDEALLAVVGAAGFILLVFFAATPALQPYYALIMPAAIGLGGLGSWALLRHGRRRAGRPAQPDEETSEDEQLAASHE